MFLKTFNPTPQSKNFFLTILKSVTNLSQLTQIHSQIIHHGLHHDLATITKLTHKLSDLNAMSYARTVFLSVPNPDLFLFNVLIRGFSNNGSPHSSISLFTHLRKFTDLKPDNFTYSFAISAAASDFADERFGVVLHGQSVVDGYGSDLFVGSAVLDFYLKFWRVDYAQKVFDRMLVRDTVLWNTMISGLVKNGLFDDSVRVFCNLVKFGFDTRVDSTTLATVLPAVAEMQELRLGLEIHCLAMKVGFHSHVYVLTGFIHMYSRCGEIELASLLFRDITRPDLVSCNSMISGYTCNGKTNHSLALFRKLLGSGEKVNSSTIVGLIPVFYPFGHLALTNCIHGFGLKSGIVSNSSVSTALTTVYTRLNEIESGRKLFDECPDKTLASWNAMISGYTQNGLTEPAVALFQEMQTSSEVVPNSVTVTCILSACAQLGALSLGKWVHSLVKSKNFESNIYVSTALIDMYAKCGNLAEARRLFDSMPEKNVVTWNAVISGYGLHGNGREALEIFSDMLRFGIEPTTVTFLSVLHACSHAGLVKEGDEIFNTMVNDHGLKPLPEHYACMVDMFGRAGQLEKALTFINGLSIDNSGPPVWGALLGACMIHKNTKQARVASEKIFELDPENMGYYVLLSNLHSTDKNYQKAASVRQIAKTKNLSKTPGCTLIEINETPHVFTSGDRTHPQSNAIYVKLEKLTGEMKDAGYQTETFTALHDVEEEEKEMMVNVHSEKLAIAFGLISTEPGTEIRIIKNLRVCLDCHTATKFISKVTQRVIVVRDANRFHHFKDGVCSCGDYW